MTGRAAAQHDRGLNALSLNPPQSGTKTVYNLLQMYRSSKAALPCRAVRAQIVERSSRAYEGKHKALPRTYSLAGTLVFQVAAARLY
jgi:hypothetical protein